LKSLIKTQFNRENNKDIDDEADSQTISQTQTKTEKFAEYLNAKWKEFKRHWMTTIEAYLEEMWNTNWKQFRVKFESQYPTIIDYMQAELID